MKKGTITIVAIIGIILICILWGISINNKIITKEEAVNEAWSQVENVYQRRMDLIPNLVNTVQGAANFERSTFTEVVEARSKANAAKIDASELTEENIANFQKAQDNLGAALSRAINITVEAYPQLTATQAFRDLQTQLEGTENRISTERNKFNTIVKEYNTTIRKFPNSIIASIQGFEKKGYFKAVEGAEKPSEVQFNF